jgi:Ca2+-binding RTX toxin-like protein
VFKGTAGDDKIYGGTNADQMEGETGNDTYYVNHAGDKIVETLHGGTNDRVYSNISHTLASHVEHLYAQGSSSIDLTGNSLTNTITGNSGANRISGGLGKDTLSGGAGKDVFAFDTKPTSSNRDKIVDFNVKNDSIWLDNKIFKKLGKKGSEDKPAQLKKNFFTIGDKAKDKNDYIIYNDKNGKLYYDADGSGKGKQVEIATLSKDLKMTHKDFFVI